MKGVPESNIVHPTRASSFTSSLCCNVAILQRVLSASVTVDKELVSSIGRGVLVFAAVAPGDTEKEAESLASKVLKLKLWDDEAGGRVTAPFLRQYKGVLPIAEHRADSPVY